jgi:hypothetical protein
LTVYWCEKWKEGRLTVDEVIRHYDIIKSAIDKASVNGVCYCELVPANCFIDGGELIFFDQEFTGEFESPRLAADVAITRAMLALTIYNHAHWGFGIKDDTFIAKVVGELKTSYGLKEDWDELVIEADKNITEKEIFSKGLTHLANVSRRIQGRSAVASEAVHETTHEAARETARETAYIPCVSLLKSEGVKAPLIYGYGSRGKALRYAFEDENVDVPVIVDKDESRLRYVTCDAERFTSLEEALANHARPIDCLVISPLDSEPILKEIRERFGKSLNLPIYTLKELLERVKNEI